MTLTEEQRTRVGTCVGIITAKGEHQYSTWIGPTLSIYTDSMYPPRMWEFNNDVQNTLKNHRFYWGQGLGPGWTTYICVDNDEETQKQYWEEVKKEEDEWAGKN